MYQKQTFQEMMQRYNRELSQMQKKAQEGARVPLRRPPEPIPETQEEGGTPDGAPMPPAPETEGGEPEFAPPPDGNECGCEPIRPLQVRPSPRARKSGCGAEDRETFHSQTVGNQGPVLLQDGVLHETLEKFVFREPMARPIHAKGWGALGSFTAYRSMREYTKACFLQEAGCRTPVLTRFSQAGGRRGSPDSARDIRGFATKFYTKGGIFDLVGNHIPVFLVRDAIRFPEAVSALSPDPLTNLANPSRFWSFLARTPEALAAALWLYSDFGTLDSYRYMPGFGVNTYVWRNAAGVRRYVKYHWLPLCGQRCLTRQEAEKLAGSDPDAAGRDLHDAIERGEPVEYELNVQLMDPAAADSLPFDPLDDTKVWSEKEYPLLPVGRLTLDRNPENFQEQVEAAAFSPANLVEGIELSEDKMLQGRSCIYWDSQRRRLGAGFRELPVNRQPDWRPENLVTSGRGAQACGGLVREGISRSDDFEQPGQFYRSLCDRDREHLAGNIAVELAAVSREIQDCVLSHLDAADAELATQVESAMDGQAM